MTEPRTLVAAAEGCVRARSARLNNTPIILNNGERRMTTAARSDAGFASCYKGRVKRYA